MTVVLSPARLPAVIEILADGDRWRLSSSDNLFSGVFLDRRTACRHAQAEAEIHLGHIVVIREA